MSAVCDHIIKTQPTRRQKTIRSQLDWRLGPDDILFTFAVLERPARAGGVTRARGDHQLRCPQRDPVQ